jgi:hypothetical protein
MALRQLLETRKNEYRILLAPQLPADLFNCHLNCWGLTDDLEMLTLP